MSETKKNYTGIEHNSEGVLVTYDMTPNDDENNISKFQVDNDEALDFYDMSGAPYFKYYDLDDCCFDFRKLEDEDEDTFIQLLNYAIQDLQMY